MRLIKIKYIFSKVIPVLSLVALRMKIMKHKSGARHYEQAKRRLARDDYLFPQRLRAAALLRTKMTLLSGCKKTIILLVAGVLPLISFAQDTTSEKTKILEKFLSEKIVELIRSDENLNLTNDDIEVKIETKKIKKIPDSIDLIEDIELINVNRINSSFKADIKINDENEGYYHQEIQGKYISVVHVPVLKKRMQAGYTIEHEDIDHVKLDARKISHETISSKEELVGKTPKLTIAAMVPIKRNLIGSVSVINKKDQVTVKYKKGNLEVTMTGIAIDSGSVGDSIRVQNPRSEQVLSGTIESKNVVVIN